MKKNIVIIILMFLVVGLAGFITYDNFFKPSTKCTEKETKKTETKEKTTTNSDSKNGTTKVEVTEKKNSDDLFKDYINNLSKSIEKKGQDCSFKTTIGNKYRIHLSTSKELRIDFDTAEISGQNMLVANDVIAFYLTDIGNGGYTGLNYLTTDGSFYSATIETSITDEKFNSSKVPFKNIISAKSYTSVDENGIGGHETVYIDIEGNTYTK